MRQGKVILFVALCLLVIPFSAADFDYTNFTHYIDFEDNLTNQGSSGCDLTNSGSGSYTTPGMINTKSRSHGATSNDGNTGSCGTNVGTGEFTVAFWINSTALGAGIPVVSNSNSWIDEGQMMFGLQTDQQAFWQEGTELTLTGNTLGLDDSTPHRILVTRNGDNITLYVDGVNDASSISAGVNIEASGIFTDHNGAFWDWAAATKVDQIIFADFPFDQDMVDADYNNGSGCDYVVNTSDGCGGAAPPGPGEPAYAHLQVYDQFDNSTVSGLTVYMGTASNTTDGSGIAYFYNQTTGLNYTVEGGATHFGVSGTAVENSTSNAYVYQGYTNVSNTFDIAGDSITLTFFNVSVASGSNYTNINYSSPIYLTNGSNALTMTSGDYLGGVGTAEITAPSNTTTNFSGLYNHTLTLQANSAENGSMIQVFNVTVYSDFDNFTADTSTGNISFNLISGRNYTIAYESLGYINSNVTYAPTNSTQYFNTTMYQKILYINITFRNETDRNVLNDTFITFNAVDNNNLYTAFNTSNGTFFVVAGFVPGLYTLRYAAEGYSNRDYYINLEYNNTYNLDLYLIPNDIYGPGVVEVREPDGSPAEGAIVELYRYYGLNQTTTEIVGMATTNNVGEAVMVAEPVNAFYFWRVLKDNNVRFNTLTDAPELLALQSDGLWHKQFIMNTTGSGYDDFTGITYNWTQRNSTLVNGSTYSLGIIFASSVASIEDCSLTLKKASDLSVINTTSGFCDSSGGLSFFLQNAQEDENLILVASYTINGNEYFVQQFYSVKYYYASDLTLKNALDDISAFSGAGFDSGSRFFIAFVLILLATAGVLAKTELMNKPAEVLLFVWGLVMLFSYAGWLYLPISTIPNDTLRQYLIAIIIGLWTAFLFYREQGVAQ